MAPPSGSRERNWKPYEFNSRCRSIRNYLQRNWNGIFQPKGTPIVTEATDAALFARALEWAFNEKNAQNQTFNITNGDVLIWHHLWPEIANYFDVPLGQKRNRTLATALPKLEKEWRLIVEKYQLKKLTLRELVGGSWQFLDRALRDAGPSPSPSSCLQSKLERLVSMAV